MDRGMSMMPRLQQSLRLCSNLAEWQSKVQRLWSFRKQHWEGGRRGRTNAPPCVSPPSYTSRSAPEWKSRIEPQVKLKPALQFKPKHACSLIDSVQSPSKSSSCLHKPSAWKEEIIPVPMGLVTQTQSQLLVGLVSRSSEAYVEQQLRHPHRGFANPELLKLGPRLSGFGNTRPSPASQSAMEDPFRREHLKHKAPMYAANIAFGRSNHAGFLQRNNDKTPRKSAAQAKYSMSVATSARREVLSSIQEYHINADARAQLTKRAENVEHEKREFVRSLCREKLF